MKDFLKFTFATVTGIIVAGVLMTFLGIITLFSMASASESETQVPEGSVMMLKLNGTLEERNPQSPLNFLATNDYESYGLDDILNSIRKAKENPDIRGIYLEAAYLDCGFASLEEIRQALQDFKESGKFIAAYSDSYTQGLYYLASVADHVLLNPHGMLEWQGLAAQPVFYKGLLEKLGVEMQIFKIGTYKSAVEPWTNTAMSDANREQTGAYLHSIWSQMTGDIAQSRHLTPEQLNDAADQLMMLQPAEESLERGLVDTLIYKNDVRSYLKRLAGIDEDDNLPVLGLKDMINVKKNQPKDKSGNIIAVYYAYGEIDGLLAGGMDGINSEDVIRDLRSLKEDEDVKAVVLRINSPGGSAYGSEQIWHAVSQLKQEKPVIVSMGDYAASGGYYIACNADTIVAQPTTLTGSIGIFGQVPNTKGLTDKLGITYDVAKTNRYADFGGINRPMSEGERQLMQAYVNQGYDLFLTRCSEGRGISKEDMDGMAQGRVWSGSMAKELGLVDELGGLDKAIEIAAAKAGIDAYTLMNYPGKKSFWSELMATDPGNYIRMQLLDGRMKEIYRQVDMLDKLDTRDYIQARMPFELHIR